jgi:hypothetical protein
VLGKVDQLGGLAYAADGGFGDVDRIAHEGVYTAVMIRVHLAVEEVNAVHLHGFEDGIDFGLVAAFGEVRYTLDECRHKESA